MDQETQWESGMGLPQLRADCLSPTKTVSRGWKGCWSFRMTVFLLLGPVGQH